jgi:tRNA pseudouridine55 synthase
MGRRRKGNVVNGWLILDKPAGMTSTQAVAAVRRAFDAQKAGHAGTLDPLATGVLPIALGEATKTVPYAVDGEKGYRFTVRFGAETTTDDSEGTVTRTSERRPSRPEIEAALGDFVGDILQTPPQFSAIKIDGERAYDIARGGGEVALEPRPVTIHSLHLIAMPDAATAEFETACGRGTYVRAIARDLGRRLGCFGHVIALRRTRVGGFAEEQAVTIEEVRAAAEAADGSVRQVLAPIEQALGDLLELVVTSVDAGRLTQGKSIILRGRDAPIEAGEAYAMCKGELIALGVVEGGEFKPSRVFHPG